MTKDTSHHYAVIVAGGSGTRLWPISRSELPKQMQQFVGEQTLLEETIDRLQAVIDKDHIYISTTSKYEAKMRELLGDIPAKNFIIEPIGRGTTAAFALLAATIAEHDPEATIFSLASDHAISGIDKFQDAIKNAYSYIDSHPSNIALLGIEQTRPDISLGYIKIDQRIQDNPIIYSVEKFVEKPSYDIAKQYLESGEYYWNAAYYCFKAKTLIEAYEEADSQIMSGIIAYRRDGVVSDFESVPEKSHEIEIINAAKFPLVLIPGGFRWSDIGSWDSLHDLLAEIHGSESVTRSTGPIVDIDSKNCLVISEESGKLIATAGINDVIIVNTDDVLLVLDRKHSQDVKSIISLLKDDGLDKYL